MIIKCQQCGLYNTDTAQRCDCGHDLTSQIGGREPFLKATTGKATSYYRTIALLFLIAAILDLTAISVYHYWMLISYDDQNIAEGHIVLAKSENVDIEKVIMFSQGQSLALSSLNKNKTMLFRWNTSLSEKGEVFELKNGNIYQKTGDLMWRFRNWGIIGGSEVQLTRVYEGDIEPYLRYMLGETIAIPVVPTVPISTPLVTLFFLVLCTVLSYVTSRRNTDKLR